MNEHEKYEEQIKELEEQLDMYHGFAVRVAQILTSKDLNVVLQRNCISLTYAKMIWPDLWSKEREAVLKELEQRI